MVDFKDKFTVSTRQQPRDARDPKTIYGITTYAELAAELGKRLPVKGSTRSGESPSTAGKGPASSAGSRRA